jgi:hypothetical protein
VHNDDLQDALEVLQSARYWHLPAARWVEVERPVDALTRAFAADDDKAFRRATTELELLGPVRAASAADPPREPAGERIRERIVELIHTLAIPRPIAEPVPDDGPDPAG